MMDIKEVLLLWFINVLIKSPLQLQINLLKVVVLKMKLNKINVFDTFSKYAWVVPLKDKIGITINAFQQILDNSTRKPNKMWVDKGSQFYNSSFKKWL